MFLLRRPSSSRIERFVAASGGLPLTYASIGLARTGAPGFDHDQTTAVVGRGEPAYRRAVMALQRWQQFELGWTQLFPRTAATSTGTVVAVLIRHLGFWSLNGARVVYQIGNPQSGCFGYAYGTLPTHAECGEEIFEVALDAQSGDVTYRILAASRPRAVLPRLGYPITRALQARFRSHSVRAMQRAVTG